MVSNLWAFRSTPLSLRSEPGGYRNAVNPERSAGAQPGTRAGRKPHQKMRGLLLELSLPGKTWHVLGDRKRRPHAVGSCRTGVAQRPAAQAMGSRGREAGLGLGSKRAGQPDCSGHRIPSFGRFGDTELNRSLLPLGKEGEGSWRMMGTLTSGMVVSTWAATTPSSSFTENLRLSMKILPKIRVRSEVAELEDAHSLPQQAQMLRLCLSTRPAVPTASC